MNQNKTRKKRRKLKPWVRRLLKVTLSLCAVVVLFFLVSELAIRVEMPPGTTLTLSVETDGSLRLTWPKVPRADRYRVEVLQKEAERARKEETLLFSADTEDNACVLPVSVALKDEVVLRINTHRNLSLFGSRFHWDGRKPLELVCRMDFPQTYDLLSGIDAEQKTLTIHWSGLTGDGFQLRVRRADGTMQELRDISPEEKGTYAAYDELSAQQADTPLQTSVYFGDDGELPLPERGGQDVFLIRASRAQEQLILHGVEYTAATVERDDLLAEQILLNVEELGENRFRLSWNEARGDGFYVQHYDDLNSEWVTVRSFADTDAHVYETGYLAAAREHQMRVISYGGKLLPGSEYAAGPGETVLKTDIGTLYATIWPAKELPLYEDAQLQREIGTVNACEALCVLEETERAFRVRTALGEGYVESDFCLINLPDYVGDLCRYNITNSYCSIYRAQGYALPEITGRCLPGYEEVLLGDGTFIVPLLYPVAKKFSAAALTTYADGYQIVMYDTLRPYVTTRFIYDTTETILDLPLPGEPYEAISLADYLQYGEKLPTEEELPPEEDETDEQAPDQTEEPVAAGEEPADQTETAEGEDPEEELPRTYRWTIMDGTYSLTYYIAAGYSSHNLGVAMDIWIARKDSPEELEMQTPIHELSYLSGLDRNNANAVLLQNYLRGAGFDGLASEWWHFLDTETRKTLNPEPVVNGLSVRGWKADDTGWRYRLSDGSFLRDTTETIDGVSFVFDARGYTER